MTAFFVEQPALVWLLAGLALTLLEVLLPGAFLIWLGVAAVGTGLVLEVAILDFSGQVILFGCLAAASITLALVLRRAAPKTNVNKPGSGLVGRSALALQFEGREGRVRVGDSDWQARLTDGSALPAAHAKLRIVGIEGTVLVVSPEMTEA